MSIRSTHTFAVLELSKAAWEEISTKLRAAGYDHAFSLDGKTIDMHGIGVEAEEKEPVIQMVGVEAWCEHPSEDDMQIFMNALSCAIAGRKVLAAPEPLPEAISTEYCDRGFGKIRVSRVAARHPGTNTEGIMTRFDVLVEAS